MLVSVGLDFRRARLDVRERFHLDDDDVPRACRTLAERGIREAVFTRTCNRVEAYCWSPTTDASDAAREICRAWVGGDEREAQQLRASATVRTGSDAARHLFRVAAGLESQVLGDVHILGQVRRALRDAIEARSVGSHLHRLFENALRAGKQVKRDTRLIAKRNSVGAEAARRAAAARGRLEGLKCVVVGCGKSGAHAARALSQLGATDLTVLNRTVDRAERLARELGGARAAGLHELASHVVGADVVIVATGAEAPVLREADLHARTASSRPLLVVDVSVPRNVDPRVGGLDRLELLDLDALHPRAASVERSRLEAVPQAEAVVETHVGDFVEWLELREARRALDPLHDILSEICRREVAHLAGASPLAERTAGRIVARLMAHPMTALRAASERREALERTTGALEVLFPRAEPELVPAEPPVLGPSHNGLRHRGRHAAEYTRTRRPSRLGARGTSVPCSDAELADPVRG